MIGIMMLTVSAAPTIAVSIRHRRRRSPSIQPIRRSETTIISRRLVAAATQLAAWQMIAGSLNTHKSESVSWTWSPSIKSMCNLFLDQFTEEARRWHRRSNAPWPMDIPSDLTTLSHSLEVQGKEVAIFPLFAFNAICVDMSFMCFIWLPQRIRSTWQCLTNGLVGQGPSIQWDRQPEWELKFCTPSTRRPRLTVGHLLILFYSIESTKCNQFVWILCSGAAPPRKSRYMDSHSNGNSNDRYDRQQASSTPAWNNGLPPSVKSFNGM